MGRVMGPRPPYTCLRMGMRSHFDGGADERTAASETDPSPHGDAFSLHRGEVRTRSLRGVFFLTFSNVGNMIVGFLASLVLARLLTPADFGVVAIGITALLLG